MSFLGIPITGHIDSFTTAILKKGFKIAPANKHLKDGRLFIGMYGNEKVLIFVCYSKTKSVYGVEVHFHVRPQEDNKELYEEYISLVREKYPHGKEKWQDDGVSYLWEIPEGSYYLENREDANGYKFRLSYFDKINSTKMELEHKNKKFEDL